eukprot:2204291-Rhodomonas_salina.2
MRRAGGVSGAAQRVGARAGPRGQVRYRLRVHPLSPTRVSAMAYARFRYGLRASAVRCPVLTRRMALPDGRGGLGKGTLLAYASAHSELIPPYAYLHIAN